MQDVPPFSTLVGVAKHDRMGDWSAEVGLVANSGGVLVNASGDGHNCHLDAALKKGIRIGLNAFGECLDGRLPSPTLVHVLHLLRYAALSRLACMHVHRRRGHACRL